MGHSSTGLAKYRVKHGPSKFARKSVLLAGMIRSQKSDAPGEGSPNVVAKPGSGHWDGVSQVSAGLEVVIEGDFPQGDNHLNSLEQAQLLQQKRTAGLKFLRRWFVPGRSTAHDCGNVAILQRESISPVGRMGLIGKIKPVQSFIEPIATSVTGKYSPGAIAAVGGWRESQHQEAGSWIPEARDRPAPIFPLLELSALCPRNGLSMGHKPWA